MSCKCIVISRYLFVNNILYKAMDKENFLKLGHKIKYERSRRGISQFELSIKTELTTRTISRIECGIIDPKYSTLIKISKALDIDIKDLLTFTF